MIWYLWVYELSLMNWYVFIEIEYFVYIVVKFCFLILNKENFGILLM